MFILMRPFYLPIFTEAMSLFSAFALLPELLQSLVRPYSKGFSVTPKGTANSDLTQALFKQTFLPSCALLGLNIVVLLQIILDLSSAPNSVGWQLALYGVIWCAINVSLLVMCVLMSKERPQPRQEHRINVQRPARMITETGTIVEGLLDDLSMSGARFTVDSGPSRERENCTRLELANGLQVPVQALWSNHRNDWVMRFAELSLEQQKGLIGYAFSGEFESAEQPQRVQLRRTFQQLWRDVVG